LPCAERTRRQGEGKPASASREPARVIKRTEESRSGVERNDPAPRNSQKGGIREREEKDGAAHRLKAQQKERLNLERKSSCENPNPRDWEESVHRRESGGGIYREADSLRDRPHRPNEKNRGAPKDRAKEENRSPPNDRTELEGFLPEKNQHGGSRWSGRPWKKKKGDEDSMKENHGRVGTYHRQYSSR